MKTVFPAHELAHIFAAQSQSYGRCSSSMSFSGKEFRSYSTVIGRFLPDGSIVLATRHYSATTAKHKAHLRNAVSHKTIHWVAHITDPVDMRSYCMFQIDLLHKKAAVAVKKRDEYLAQAQTLADNLNGYFKAIKCKLKVKVKAPNLDKIKIQVKKESAAELARRKERDAKRAEQARLDALKAQEALAEWRTGAGFAHSLYSLPIALRVNEDKIETSHGASIPLQHAKTLHRFLSLAKTDSQRRRLCGKPLGVFKITSCTEDVLTVGCHAIAMTEIKEMAVKLGLAP